jgi:hypothetical protein
MCSECKTRLSNPDGQNTLPIWRERGGTSSPNCALLNSLSAEARGQLGMPLRGCPVLCSAGQRMLFCGGSFEGRRSAAQSPSFSEKHKNALDGGGAPRRRSGAEHKRKLSRLDRIFTLIHSNRVVSRIGEVLHPRAYCLCVILTPCCRFAGAAQCLSRPVAGGNGKLWPEGWGNAELLTQLEETHARRRSRDRCGMLYDVGGSTARIGAHSSTTPTPSAKR